MWNHQTNRIWLGLRSISMIILFPGLVVGLIPFGFFISSDLPHFSSWSGSQIAATLLAGAGLAVLFRCVWEFAYFGKGTLAPFDEPKALVIEGLYQYSRNPMYAGVYMILLAESWFFASLEMLTWTGIFFLCSSVFVIVFEEPRLVKKHGKAYEDYRAKVNRWLPGKKYVFPTYAESEKGR